MMHTWRRFLVVPRLAISVASCGEADTDGPIVVDPGVTVAGLTFTLAGATLTVVNAALSTPDTLIVAPILALNRAPTATQNATISVSAAEPFQAVLIQPAGSTSYLRVFLPAQTTLIGVTVIANPGGGATAAASATIAVSNGGRASKTAALSLLAASN